MAILQAIVLSAIASPNPSVIATALTALGGAIVGATISAATQWSISSRQAKRQDAAHRKDVLIAARMMLTDLARAWSNLQYCIDHQEWWRTTGLASRLTADDRRLVLGELTAEGFYTLDRADAAIDHWYGIRDYELGRTPTRHASVTIGLQLDKLREIVGWIDEAQRALRELTGDPDSIDEPLELDGPGPAQGLTRHLGPRRP